MAKIKTFGKKARKIHPVFLDDFETFALEVIEEELSMNDNHPDKIEETKSPRRHIFRVNTTVGLTLVLVVLTALTLVIALGTLAVAAAQH